MMNIYKIKVYVLGTGTFPSVLQGFYLFVCSAFSGQISTSGCRYTSLQAPHLLARAWPLQMFPQIHRDALNFLCNQAQVF